MKTMTNNNITVKVAKVFAALTLLFTWTGCSTPFYSSGISHVERDTKQGAPQEVHGYSVSYRYASEEMSRWMAASTTRNKTNAEAVRETLEAIEIEQANLASLVSQRDQAEAAISRASAGWIGSSNLQSLAGVLDITAAELKDQQTTASIQAIIDRSSLLVEDSAAEGLRDFQAIEATGTVSPALAQQVKSSLKTLDATIKTPQVDTKVKDHIAAAKASIVALYAAKDSEESIFKTLQGQVTLKEQQLDTLRKDPLLAQYEALAANLRAASSSPQAGPNSQAAGPTDDEKKTRDALKDQRDDAMSALKTLAQFGDGASIEALVAQRRYADEIDRVYQRYDDRIERKQIMANSMGNYTGPGVSSSTMDTPLSAWLGVETKWDTYASTGGEVRVSQGKQVGLLGLPVYLAKEVVSLAREVFSGENTPLLAGTAAAVLATEGVN